jgi:hypothetical protein
MRTPLIITSSGKVVKKKLILVRIDGKIVGQVWATDLIPSCPIIDAVELE